MRLISDIINIIIFNFVIIRLIIACSAHRAMDYIRAYFTLVFGMCVLYFGHVANHKFKNGIVGKLHAMHHNPKIKNEWYAMIIEFIYNSQLLIFILFNNVFKQITRIELFSNYILFAIVFLYIWTHWIEQHCFPDCVHKYHHTFDAEENHDPVNVKNYGPHIMDRIFNTYHDCNNDNANVYLAKIREYFKLGFMYYATSLLYKIKK